MKLHTWFFAVLVCLSVFLGAATHCFSAYQCTTSDPVKLVSNGTNYPSIQAAYVAASSNDTILLAADYFNENLLMDSSKLISLAGGYDCDFQSDLNSTIIQSLTISGGTASTSNIVLSSFSPTCQPGEPNNFPGNSEICDCEDNNCNGLIDDGLLVDADGDGYSAAGSCGGSGDDCDDSNPGIHPYGEILGDGIDQDCNGVDLFPGTQENPDAAGGTPCVTCHDWDGVNYFYHNETSATDSTCVVCHAPQVNSMLPGHYGLPTTGGPPITCATCHVPWDNSTGHAGSHPYWDLVKATGYANLTCDTCHVSRAATHATGSAHDLRVIDSACGQCHTSDTSILGDPGNGTLTSQVDVDSLHQNDCALCHAYTGSKICPQTVEQAIEDGMNGAQISCTACHSAHHSPETNQVFYDPLIDTSQPAQQGCALCHHDYDIVNGTSLGLSTWQTILVEHDLDGTKDGSSSACASCHGYGGNSTPPLADVQNTIAAGGPTSCASCHTDKVPDVSHGSPESGKHPEHLVLAGIFGCSTCHAGIPYFQSGIDTNSDGLYDLAETDVCNPCHQDWDQAGLPAERDYKTGWYDENFALECTYCHAEPVDNGDNTPTAGRREVVGEFPVADAHAHYGAILDSTSCQVCHDHTNHSDGLIELLDPDGGAGYSFIYPADMTTDPDVSNFCSNCHDADGATRLATPLDPFANGNVSPDVASRFLGTLQWNEWYGDGCFGYEGSQRGVNSHHDISDADQAFSGAKIECLDCHGAHTSSASQKLTDPFATNVAWTGTNNDFCLSCHSGEHGPNDVVLPAEVLVPEFYTEPPVNVPGESCGAGMIYDCSGVCVTQIDADSAASNGICDDLAPDFDCNIFGFDNGDCLPVNTPNTECATGMVYDCADNCVTQTDVNNAFANTTCDDLVGLDLNCAEFNYDLYDCSPCEGNNCSTIGGVDTCNYYTAPWWVQMTWTNEAHGDGSKRQWGNYSGAPEVPALDCMACHDPHGSYDATNNPGGNPYLLRDFVDGTPFIDDGSRDGTWFGPPWETTGTAGPVVITNPTPEDIGPQLGDQLCVKCHADWLPAMWAHSSCGGCLSCHSHGHAWGADDWGNIGLNDADFCP